MHLAAADCWSALNSEPLSHACASSSSGSNKTIQIIGFILAIVAVRQAALHDHGHPLQAVQAQGCLLACPQRPAACPPQPACLPACSPDGQPPATHTHCHTAAGILHHVSGHLQQRL